MNLLRAILAGLLLPTCSWAATIVGNLGDVGLAAVRTNVLFLPLSTPGVVTNRLILSIPKTITTDSAGNFSTVLAAGDYGVRLGSLGRDICNIAVPTNAATYNLVDLITNQLTYTYTFSPTYEQRVNRGVAGGYATLDESGTIPTNQLPASVFLGGSSISSAALTDDDSGEALDTLEDDDTPQSDDAP